MKLTSRQALAGTAAALLLALPLSACTAPAPATKPAKEKLAASLLEQVGGGEPGSITHKVVLCMVDKIYDQLSPQALNAIADKAPYKSTAEEDKILEDAGDKCAKELVK